MKTKHFIAFLLLATLTFVACGKDDDDDEKEPPVKSKHEMLYDKWWYDVGGDNRDDHKFDSDGTWQMTTTPVVTGNYEWLENDSLLLTYDAYPDIKLVYYFPEITETTMKFWPKNEPEGNIYEFSTTKP